ncbi:MAG TPA: DNA polymerase III subunit alpha, partial [Rhodospirillales bacterium]|nr:DNA polymerase III subunit alpha [Rhodospirillales bacterium]
EPELARIVSGRLAELMALNLPASGRDRERMVTVAGLVIGLRVRNTRRGRMAFLTLDDRTGRLEVRVFTDTFEQYRHKIARDRILVIRGNLALDDYSGVNQLTADEILDMAEARARMARGLVIRIDERRAANGFARELARVLEPFREGGECPIWLDYRNRAARARVRLGDDWTVFPADELIGRLRELAGEGAIEVDYS